MVQNVALGTFSGAVHVDAVIDTGSTFCVVPPIFARLLGFAYSNRLEGRRVNVIGGGSVEMDIHRLEWVRVGSARAFDVMMGVAESFGGQGLEKCSSASPLSSSLGPSLISTATAWFFVLGSQCTS